MGLNDEYSRDADNYDGNAYDSDGSDDFDTELHPEDWQDMYSQELLDGWMKIREYAESRYMTVRATYPKFVELVLDSSRWYQEHESAKSHFEMWNLISNLPVISDRVQAENFFGWAEKYIGYL
jgi:hypothetical protein